MAEGIVHDTESKMEEFKDQLPADEVWHLLACYYQSGENVVLYNIGPFFFFFFVV